LWSSVGLSVAICVGFENFKAILDGARDMDIHFRTTPLNKNMPVIMALVNIWYNNFLGTHTQAVIPYCERLALLPSYLQQLEMESNGKSVSLDDKHALLFGAKQAQIASMPFSNYFIRAPIMYLSILLALLMIH